MPASAGTCRSKNTWFRPAVWPHPRPRRHGSTAPGRPHTAADTMQPTRLVLRASWQADFIPPHAAVHANSRGVTVLAARHSPPALLGPFAVTGGGNYSTVNAPHPGQRTWKRFPEPMRLITSSARGTSHRGHQRGSCPAAGPRSWHPRPPLATQPRWWHNTRLSRVAACGRGTWRQGLTWAMTCRMCETGGLPREAHWPAGFGRQVPDRPKTACPAADFDSAPPENPEVTPARDRLGERRTDSPDTRITPLDTPPRRCAVGRAPLSA